MVSISVVEATHKLTKIGSSSMAAVLPKDWVDKIISTLETDEIILNIFGKYFLVIEVEGLEIKDKEDRKLLQKIKKHFSD